MQFKTSRGILNIPGEWEGVVCFEKQVEGANWDDDILNDKGTGNKPKIGCYYYNGTAAKNLPGGTNDPFYHALVKNTNGTSAGLRPFALDTNTLYINKGNMLAYIHKSSGLSQVKVELSNKATTATSAGITKTELWDINAWGQENNGDWITFVHRQDLSNINPGPMLSYQTRTVEISKSPMYWYNTVGVSAGMVKATLNLTTGQWTYSHAFFRNPAANIVAHVNGNLFDIDIHLYADSSLCENTAIDIHITEIYQQMFQNDEKKVVPVNVLITPGMSYNVGYPVGPADVTPRFYADINFEEDFVRISSHSPESDYDYYYPERLFIKITGTLTKI